MVPVPCTPETLYHVVPPSGDASNRTVSVKVPRSCTSAVCWPVTLMETVSPSLVTEQVAVGIQVERFALAGGEFASHQFGAIVVQKAGHDSPLPPYIPRYNPLKSRTAPPYSCLHL